MTSTVGLSYIVLLCERHEACTATNRDFGCSRIGCCYWERRGFGVSPSRALFLEFFSSWEVPVAFLCISFVLVGLCFWISTRAEGIYEGLAIAGVAVSAMTSVVLIVLQFSRAWCG